jgi:hypothetical protein
MLGEVQPWLASWINPSTAASVLYALAATIGFVALGGRLVTGCSQFVCFVYRGLS